jgi:integrase
MASIYRRTRRYPIPDGAEIVTDRKGQRFAKWTDRKTKRTRKEPLNADGDKVMVKSGNYLIAFFGADGKRRTENSGTPDRATAERIAGQLENEAALKKAGIVNATQERFATEGRRPLAEHVCDFERFLTDKGNTAKHVRMTCQHIRWLLEASQSQAIPDLTGPAILRAVGKLRDSGKSLRTCNSYLTAAKAFSRWLWEHKRTPDDALCGLESFNADTDRRHVRRELTDEELAYLLPFVQSHTLPMHNLPGPDRAMVYRLALGTGFRADELRSLKPSSFDLDSDPPTVTVDAAYSKRRRQDVQPIRSDLTEILRPWLAEQPVGALVFGNLPGGTARMLRSDLAAARKKWIADAENDGEEQDRRERSEFLQYENAAGEVADFHGATRHGYISAIVAGGASVKTAQELARHSTPVLTIGRYSHARLHDLTGALEALPDLQPKPTDTQPQAMAATGTDNAIPDCNMAAYRQQYGSKTVQKVASRRERNSDCPGDDDHRGDDSQVIAMTSLSDNSRDVAEPNEKGKEKRRRPDSNRRWRICNPLP